MQGNYLNNYQNVPIQPQNPNAVSINIYSPQAFGQNGTQNPISYQNPEGYYSMYGTNQMPNMPLYPANYNVPINYSNNAQNPIAPNQQNGIQNPAQMYPNQQYQQPYPQYYPQQQIAPNQTPQNQTPELVNQANMLPDNNNGLNNNNNNSSKTNSTTTNETSSNKTDDKKEKDKIVIPLTDDYVKNLENYMNSSNPKIRLVGMKEIMERFKEDENRKDNKSLVPLLNKALKDTSASIRFLALTTLQLGYSVGDDETVQLLVKIANENQDKFGQDAILASEVLLKLSAPEGVKVKEGEG